MKKTLILLIGFLLVGCEKDADNFYAEKHISIDWVNPNIDLILSRHAECQDKNSVIWVRVDEKAYREEIRNLCNESDEAYIQIVRAKMMCDLHSITGICERVNGEIDTVAPTQFDKQVNNSFKIPKLKTELFESLVSPSYLIIIVIECILLTIGFSSEILIKSKTSRIKVFIVILVVLLAIVYFRLLPVESGSQWIDAMWQREVLTQIPSIIILIGIFVPFGMYLGHEWLRSRPLEITYHHRLGDISLGSQLFLDKLLELQPYERSSLIQLMSQGKANTLIDKLLEKRMEELYSPIDVEEESSAGTVLPTSHDLSNMIKADAVVDSRIGSILQKFNA